MNFDAMTIDECRDYIAEAMGFRKTTDGVNSLWYFPRIGGEIPTFPDITLDAAAASLPEGWLWDVVQQGRGCKWRVSISLDGDDPERCARADTERLARFRAACKAWAYTKEAK